MTVEHYHTILDYIRRTIAGTQWEGKVYAVGGCCRDEILGVDINDIDLAVELAGGGIGFADWLFDQGLTMKEPVRFPSFGTARVELADFPDVEVEFVQTRAEKYTDSTRRDPTTVFGSIEADCRRRDLTINALYYDISRQTMLDILGCSIDDIRNHIIRTPADPQVTFDDDPVRILRAIRFAARYGWEIQPSTFEGMKANAERLRIVRPERMQAEFNKMLLGPHPSRALELLRLSGSLPYIMEPAAALPRIQQGPLHFGTVWEHTLAVVDNVPPVPVLRLAALCHDMGKIEAGSTGKDGRITFPRHEHRGLHITRTALRRLHYDSSDVVKVCFLIANHKAAKNWGPHAEKMTDMDLRRLQSTCGTAVRFNRLLELIDADNRAFAPEYAQTEQVAAIRRRSEQLIAEGTALFSFKQKLPLARIRKIKGLGPNDKAEPYVDYVRNLLLNDPTLSKIELAARLSAYNPGKKRGTASRPRPRRRSSRKK